MSQALKEKKKREADGKGRHNQILKNEAEKAREFMLSFPLIARELRVIQMLYALLYELIHLCLQRANGNSYSPLPAKCNSHISQRRNSERLHSSH